MKGADNITQDTTITYPAGHLEEEAMVVATESLPDGKLAVLTDCSPFHPVDHLWPDQPADRGELVVGDRHFSVIECVTAAFNRDSQELVIDQAIKARGIRRDQVGWLWLVAHVVEAPDELENEILNQPIRLNVDGSYRVALSQAHSLCHFAALALNQVIVDTLGEAAWRKPCSEKDSLGHNNFDQLAMTSSKIYEWESVDQYRVGKSLRKKAGIQIVPILESLVTIQERVQSILNEWLALEPRGRIEPPVSGLSAPRAWHARLGEREVIIPCGGTHASLFGPGRVETNLTELTPESFEMQNRLILGGGDGE